MIARLLKGLAVSGLITSLAACQSIPSRSDLSPEHGAQYATIDDLLRSRNSDVSIAETEDVIEVTPELLTDAWARVDRNACESALDIARGILRSDRSSFEARLIQAECTYRGGDFASATVQFNTLLAESRDARILRGLGLIAARESRFAEARAYLNEALTLRQDDWRVWNTVGFLDDVQQNWESAQNAYEQAARLAPERAAPLNNLGLSYLQRGDYEAANAAFTEAGNRQPGFAPADTNLRITLIMQGQVERALWGIDDHQRPEVLNNAGVIARSQGDLDLAASLFQRALDESPVFYEQAYENLQQLRAPGR